VNIGAVKAILFLWA
jgi:hypothetical protein